MPRNFYEMKSVGGGTIAFPILKSGGGGGGSRPPRPPPIDAVFGRIGSQKQSQ